MTRTVSLLPAATEIVGALGLMDQLLAVSHECDYPDEANHRPRVTHCEIFGAGLPSAAIDQWVVERLHSGGSLYTLDEPRLRELKPELILTQKLRDANPDVLIIACCGHDVERTRKDLPRLEALPGWREMRAVREHRTFIANGSAYFSRPGPRIVDTLEMIATALHPKECDYPDRR